MDHASSRMVMLVLCREDGSVLGFLPPFEVDVPWWQEVGSVVAGARARFGLDVTVLRLLEGNGDPPGGDVTYLAEVDTAPAVPLTAWESVVLDDEPLRLPYAKPGGPRADLEWADGVLAARGTPRVAPAEQVRTWNLSSLWRLPLVTGAAWLKVVPSFFRHEGEMLARLDPAVVPPLIAADGTRVLLGEVPGNDLYEAPLPLLLVMVRLLVDLQTHWSTRLRALDDIALPEWRVEALIALADDVAARTAEQLDAPTRSGLERLVRDLPARFAAVTACGIPDSLVHGDFHPGNVRGDADRIVLLDWGDCGIGHPLLDQAAFLTRIAPAARRPVAEEWTRLWRTAVPSSDPRCASKLLAPVAALRQAIVYRGFLDGIEPSERVYHRGDPARWLIRAVELTRTEDRARIASRP